MSKPPAGGPTLHSARQAVQQRIDQIDAELAEVAALEAERQRLSSALELLEDARKPLAARRPGEGPKAAITSSGKSKRTSRARGRIGNRDRVAEFLATNPDSEAGAVVEHVGASRAVVYNLLGRLVDQGIIERHQGPRNRAQYRLAATQPEKQGTGVEPASVARA